MNRRSDTRWPPEKRWPEKRWPEKRTWFRLPQVPRDLLDLIVEYDPEEIKPSPVIFRPRPVKIIWLQNRGFPMDLLDLIMEYDPHEIY